MKEKLIAEELVSKPPREEFSLDAKTLLAYYMLTQQVRPCRTVVCRTVAPLYGGPDNCCQSRKSILVGTPKDNVDSQCVPPKPSLKSVSTGLRNSPGASPKEESTRGSDAGSWHQTFLSQASFGRDIL